MRSKIYEQRFFLLFVAIFIVYFLNMFINVMEVDAAQYAFLSMEMSMNKSFLQVYQYGQDYLDKPPLLFWMSSLSYLLFGISNFAYKLPSVLFAILGIYSTFRFSKIWYSYQKAVLAALIIASSQAYFLFTNDIRTDTLLTSSVIFAVWQMSEYLKNGKWINLVFTSAGIAMGMMAKGPIALIAAGTGYFFHFMVHKDWKNIFKWQWLLAGVLIAIFLLPMNYGLYTQFDLHPEKYVYGLQGPSGLKFFYWTQSFGRITGDIYWSDNRSFFYFFHTILWDFQPWVFLFIPALALKIISLFKSENRKNPNTEFVCLFAFVLIFLALSASNFKLPHYIFVIFPFAAVITADFIYELSDKYLRPAAMTQFGMMHIFWILTAVYYLLFFPPKNILIPALMLILFSLAWIAYKNLTPRESIFIPAAITIISFNLLMSAEFYPNLLSYQSTSEAGKYLYENISPEVKFYYYDHKDNRNSRFSFDFYSKQIVETTNIKGIRKIEKGSQLFIYPEGIEELKKKNIKYDLIKTLPDYKVTALTLPFLLKSSRKKKLKQTYIIELK